MKYRVEKRILPVEFFLNIYRMLQDIILKIGTDISYVGPILCMIISKHKKITQHQSQ